MNAADRTARRGWRWIGLIGVFIVAAACANSPNNLGEPGAPTSGPAPQELVDAWDAAISSSGGGLPAVIMTSPLQDQIGEWSNAEAGHNKMALLSGRVVAGADVAAATAPVTATIGTAAAAMKRVPVISAARAAEAIVAGGNPANDCDEDCNPIVVQHPELITSRVSTTAGSMDVPTWSFQVRDSAVRITQVAVDTAALTRPPAIVDQATISSNDQTATRTGSTDVSVTFTGSLTGEPPCGRTYAATAVESAQVVAIVIQDTTPAVPGAADQTCTSVGMRRTVTATLNAPLGTRLIINGPNRNPPRTDQLTESRQPDHPRPAVRSSTARPC